MTDRIEEIRARLERFDGPLPNNWGAPVYEQAVFYREIADDMIWLLTELNAAKARVDSREDSMLGLADEVWHETEATARALIKVQELDDIRKRLRKQVEDLHIARKQRRRDNRALRESLRRARWAHKQRRRHMRYWMECAMELGWNEPILADAIKENGK